MNASHKSQSEGAPNQGLTSGHISFLLPEQVNRAIALLPSCFLQAQPRPTYSHDYFAIVWLATDVNWEPDRNLNGDLDLRISRRVRLSLLSAAKSARIRSVSRIGGSVLASNNDQFTAGLKPLIGDTETVCRFGNLWPHAILTRVTRGQITSELRLLCPRASAYPPCVSCAMSASAQPVETASGRYVTSTGVLQNDSHDAFLARHLCAPVRRSLNHLLKI